MAYTCLKSGIHRRLLSQNNMAPGKVKAFRLSCLCELTLLVLDIAAAMNKPVDTLYSCLNRR